MTQAPDIPGAEDVVSWFGQWPAFHDAEVLSITLDRARGARIEIRTATTISETTTLEPGTSETGSSSRHMVARRGTVTFVLEGFPPDEQGITNTRIDGFNHQNVLWGLSVEKTAAGGYVVRLDGIFGVDGSIGCEQMSVEVAE